MVKTDLSKYNNTWYSPGNSLKRMVWYYVNIIIFKSSLLPFNSLKVFLLKVFGAKISTRVVIKPNVNIKYPWFLEIGDYSWVGEGVWIDNLAKVTIGKNVCISQGAFILCGNHNYKKSTFDLMVKEIILEDGVWIGSKAIVCQGVTCHTHSVLGVGSVANADLDAYSIYSGNPAIKVRERVIV